MVRIMRKRRGRTWGDCGRGGGCGVLLFELGVDGVGGFVIVVVGGGGGGGVFG